jgi:formate dehydrogenase subunit gamma
MTAIAAPARVHRFDGMVRVVHWTVALLLLVAMTTGFVLYVGSLSAVVGRRELLRNLHVWSGLAAPLPILVAYLAPGRAALRRDVRSLARWSDDDLRWLRSFGRRARDRVGKFNGGQKANAVFVAGALPVMVMTGVIMRWYEPFPLDWRTGATFVHDWTAIALWIVTAGHIVKSLMEPAALRSMISGWMSTRAARAAHPAWIDDECSGGTEARIRT